MQIRSSFGGNGLAYKVFALVAALVALAPSARADEPQVRFDVEHLEVDGKIHSVDAVDLDGDGKLDLIAAVVKGEKPNTQRSLAVFWNHTGSFAGKPDLVIPIGAETCAYDFAALDDKPGYALLAVTSGGISARRFLQRELQAPAPLVQQQTFCLGAPRNELRRFHAAQRLGATGETGLLVPSLGALSIYRRAGAEMVKRSELPLELETEVESSGAGADENRKAAVRGISRLSVSLEFPSIEVLDVNGDGRPDIVVHHALRLRAFFQAADGTFSSKPDLDHTFLIDTGKAHEGKWQEPSLRLADLDGDGHIDAVISKMSSEGLTSAHTAVYLFMGSAEGFRDKPDQVLSSDGGGFGVFLADFSGTGRPSLIVSSFKFGVMAIIRMLTSSTIKVNFQLYPFGPDRRFSASPSAERTLKFHFDPEGKSDQPVLDPEGDYQGDKKPNLAFGTEEGELSIYGSQKDALFTDDTIAKINVRAYGDALAIDLDGQGRGDLVLYYPRSAGHESELAVVHNRGK